MRTNLAERLGYEPEETTEERRERLRAELEAGKAARRTVKRMSLWVSGGARLQCALRQAHRLRAQQNADIRRVTLNVLLIGTQEQQRTLRLCRRRGGEHGPVDGGKPRHGSAAGNGAAVQRRQQLLKLRQSR